MKFVIGASNVKVFAKSVLALFKTGEEIYVEPLEESLTLRTVNSSRSAFAFVEFNRSFFVTFEPELSNKASLNSTTLNNTTIADQSILGTADSEPFKCKIPARCLLSIFKNVHALEKNVEKCTITVKYVPLSQESASKVFDYDTSMITKRLNKNNEEQLFDIKFLIIMNCKHGMRKTFIISISDCENLQAAFSTDNCSNKLNIGAKYLNETINCFSNDTEEVSFIVKSDQLYIKNYVQSENGSDNKSVNTQVNFDSDEFNVYEIEKETDITFCLKEFKACLQFGFFFDLTLDICFQRKGRPIIFVYQGNSSYKASFTLATLSEELAPSQCTSISSHPANDKSLLTNTSVFNASNNFNNSYMPAPADENEITNNRTSATTTAKSKITISKMNPDSRPAKGSKRSLCDTSNNQTMLDESQIRAEIGMTKSTIQVPDSEDDEDDELLTQALEKQEQVLSQRSMQKDSQTPPAKKQRSLVQSLFEEEDDGGVDDSNNNASVKKISFATLCQNSQSDDSSDEDENNTTCRKTNSIYVADSDSE